MTLDNWLEQFDQLPPTSARKVAVLGAGIAGLVAAEQLARRGHEVTVFEADGRVGGRILTHRYAGCHAELGAMRIPASHNLTLAYSERTKVDLQPFYNADPHALFRLRGATIPQADTAAWLDLYAVSDNERQWLMRRPNYLLTKIIMKLSHGLNEQDIQAIRNSDIAHASERVQQLDRVALRDFALQHLDTQDSVMLLGAQHYLTEVWHCSCIALLKEVFGARTEGLTQAQPGMDQIPLRLFEMLGKYENIHFEMPTQVTTITTTDQYVALEFVDAPPQRFDRGLCTIPFPVLKQMSLTGLSAGKQAAINSFTYLASTKVMLNFKESFWQPGEQGLAGGISVSDDISGQIVYPSIPHLQHSSPETAELPAQYPGIFAGEFRPSDRNTGGPGILMSYTWGESARRLGVLPPAQRLEVVLRTVAALHGQAAMDAFDGGTSIAWDQHRWSGGAFGAPLVGDLLLYREAAIRPEAALYFAGEHLSGDPGWIQGAIESALTASKALLTDLR